MLNDILRRSNKTLAALLLGASTLFLQSCGGGGTSGDTGLRLGDLSILPGSGSIYAGVPTTFTIAGGRAPYILASSEPTILPLNFTVNGNSVTVVANNPGVIDVGLDPNAVPSRSVIITVRDNAGTQITATYSVLQNFMTGYSIAVNSINSCGAVGATISVAACAGFESRVDVRPTSAGLLRAQRQLRFSVLYGPLGYIQDDNITLASTYLLTTDSTGNGRARFVPTLGSFTQFAAIRITDVQTGAFVDVPFTLLSAPTAALTALPAALPTLTGANTTQCGAGQGTIIVSGGTPPYTASTTNPLVQVSPASVTTAGGSFTVLYGGGLPPTCNSGQVVIRDAVGTIISVDANSAPGTTAPVQTLAVSPSAFCFTTAGQTGLAQVTGGAANKVVNSSNTTLATVAPTVGVGNFAITITAVGAGIGTAVVSINDGTAAASVSVTRAAVCP